MVTKQEEVDIVQMMPDDDLFRSVFPLMSHQQLEELQEISIIPGSFSDLEGLSPVRLDEEVTMDVAELKFVPVTKYGPPERTVFSGDLKFEVQVNSSDVHKRKYLFSSKLNRIYVDMNTNFSMQFVWDFANSPQPMFVRATTVFSDEAQQEKRVDRCLQHTHSHNPADGADPSIVRHVLRSTREMGAKGVYYCGGADSWLSVLVQHEPRAAPAHAPAPAHAHAHAPAHAHAHAHAPAHAHAHAPACSHAYQFVCKNSCSTGINRRAIAVLFTLEDAIGTVYGRQMVGARVCACPRRDMLKDEETEGAYLPGKKRVASNKVDKHEAKKVKVEVLEEDEAVHTLGNGVQIIGNRALTTGLNVMLNMMQQAASYKRNDPPVQEKYSKAIAGLRGYIDQVSKK